MQIPRILLPAHFQPYLFALASIQPLLSPAQRSTIFLVSCKNTQKPQSHWPGFPPPPANNSQLHPYSLNTVLEICRLTRKPSNTEHPFSEDSGLLVSPKPSWATIPFRNLIQFILICYILVYIHIIYNLPVSVSLSALWSSQKHLFFVTVKYSFPSECCLCIRGLVYKF